MAITCPRCGTDFDVTLFEYGHQVRCDCGEEIGYPGKDLQGGHVVIDLALPRKNQPKVTEPPNFERQES